MLPDNLPTIQPTEITLYSPSAIINIIQNVYVSHQEKKLIGLRGIYLQKGKVSYHGFWFDELRDESSDYSIRLVVPELIRNQLTDNKTIEIICYITKKAETNGSITLRANLTDLLTQTQNKFNEEEIKALEIQQQKSDIGFRDLDSFIKKCIYDNHKPVIKIVIGRSAIIQEDIKDQMGEAVAFYDISFVYTSLNSIHDIIEIFQSVNNEEVDIIVISRGGGEEVETLNKSELAEYCINLNPFFVTAIAHKEIVPLLEKIADKKFITPTAFGQYLKDIYNNTVQDFEQSKAKLVNDVTQQLKANYDKQITNLAQQLKAEQELKAKTLTDKETIYKSEVTALSNQITEKDKMLTQVNNIVQQYKTSADSLQKRLSSKESSNTITFVIIFIIAIIIGLLIGLSLK